MRKNNFRTRLRLLIILSLLLFSLLGFAVGKYIMEINAAQNVLLTFSNNLADVFEVREHKVSYDINTGSYTFTDTILKDGQSYNLIPGVDLKKDPYVYIEGRSNISANLYIEIVDTLDVDGIKLVDYTVISDNWETTDKTPEHGGIVYKYKGTVTDGEYYILQGNNITVSQHVKSKALDDGKDVLTIYAYLEEISSTSP